MKCCEGWVLKGTWEKGPWDPYPLKDWEAGSRSVVLGAEGPACMRKAGHVGNEGKGLGGPSQAEPGAHHSPSPLSHLLTCTQQASNNQQPESVVQAVQR